MACVPLQGAVCVLLQGRAYVPLQGAVCAPLQGRACVSLQGVVCALLWGVACAPLQDEGHRFPLLLVCVHLQDGAHALLLAVEREYLLRAVYLRPLEKVCDPLRTQEHQFPFVEASVLLRDGVCALLPGEVRESPLCLVDVHLLGEASGFLQDAAPAPPRGVVCDLFPVGANEFLPACVLVRGVAQILLPEWVQEVDVCALAQYVVSECETPHHRQRTAEIEHALPPVVVVHPPMNRGQLLPD